MFDKTKTIKLVIENMVTVITMSPIFVKHLDELDKLKDAYRDDDPETIQDICVKLLEETIDVELSDIPLSSFNELIDIFIDFNFDGVKDGTAKRKTKNQNDNILQCIDFLISEGHNYVDILNYTVPSFIRFVDLALDRKGSYKTKNNNPVDMLKKIGVKINA